MLVAGQLAIGMRATRTASITGDEPFYLLTTQSLLSDGDLDLADEYAERDYERFWDGSVDLWRQMEPASSGRLLSPHEPGLSVLVLPAYALGGLRGVQRFLVVLWAAAMACSALVAARSAAPRAAAGVAAVVAGAGAPGLVYASQVYPEAPAALAVSIGLLVLTAARPRALALAAVVVGMAWLGVRYAPLAAVLAGVWAWKWRRERAAVVAFTAVAAAAAVHWVWWHLRVFDALTPYATNVVWAGEGTGEIVADHIRVVDRSYRLYGVFLDARFGLLRWLPVAGVAVLGIARRTLLPLALVATSVVIAAFASITIMGWWFPGRLLVASFPALVVLLAFGVARLPRVALVLGAWSLAIAAAVAWAAHTGSIRLAVDPWVVGAPLAPAWLFPDFRSFGAREVAVSLAWAAGFAVVVLATRSRLRRRAMSMTAGEGPHLPEEDGVGAPSGR